MTVGFSPRAVATYVVLGILGAFMATEASGQIDCQCETTAGLHARKNIDCLTPHELEVLKHAFDIVKKRSAADPTDKKGYAYQVRIHGDRRVGPCEHGSELIWPWHRAQIFYFENLLRETDPDHATLSTKDLTIPYWDWTKPASGVHGYPKAYEDPSSPLFHDGRNQYSAANPPPLVTDPDIGLDLKQWYLFGGSTTGPGNLERRAHNNVHGDYVGGDMAFPAISVQDPIFWAHHANLDRMWDQWQQTFHQNPVSQNTKLRGWDSSFVPEPVVKNFNDIREQLKYEYCPHMNIRRIDLNLAGAIKAPRKDLAAIPLTLEAKLPEKPFQDAQVRLYGVKTPIETTYRARVFIHPASVACQPNDPNFVRSYLANTFTLWKMGRDHMPEDKNAKSTHPATQDIFLDVTQKLKEVKAKGLAPNDSVAVSMDFTELGDKKVTKKIGYGDNEVQFKQAVLDLDPAPPTAAPMPEHR